MTAVASGYEATFYNPAGLAIGGRRELTFGYLRVLSDLSIRTASSHSDQPIADPDLFLIGAVAPAGKHFAVGFASYLLPARVLYIDAPGPEEPFFPYYRNRSQRLLLLPGIAVRPFDWLSVGIAINFFSGLGGSIQASEGPTRQVEPAVSEELPTRAAPHVGLRVQPIPELAFGATYRHAFRIPYTTTTETVVAGTPLNIAIDAQGLQTPHEIAVGSELRLGPVALSLDGTYLLWAEERGPFVRVRALISGVELTRLPPEDQYRNVFNVRFGLAVQQQLDPKLVLTWRAGQFYEPSFVVDQPGRSNLIDGPKLGWSAGAGLAVSGVLSRPVRFDAHLQLVNMLSRRSDKVVSSVDQARSDPNALADDDPSPGLQIGNPGYPFVAGGGRVMTLGATVTFEVEP